MRKPQFIIAAPSSGTGKTTVTLGILRALKRRGFQVQPFKCGPDYIDPMHHKMAAETPSINLDLFMGSSKHVQQLYAHYSKDCDVAVVEGVMGLFDGARKMEGSSAAIAALLDIPVILVVNAKATAYSVAPLLYGFKHFFPQINLAGVIFNFVNSDSHYQFLKEACEDVGVKPLGYLPREEGMVMPSRHLGLAVSPENDYEQLINKMADHIASHLDLDGLLDLTEKEVPLITSKGREEIGSWKIAVAKDEAFNFTYPQNLRVLEEMGEVTYFSPLHDAKVLECDFIYLAGGYPELFLEELSNNKEMLQALRTYCESGGRLLAECGGMMYLCREIETEEGKRYPMVGFLDQVASMNPMRLHLGYRKAFIGEKELRGHEFHYSHLKEIKEELNIAKVATARDRKMDTLVQRKNNTIATYIHFYWGENHDLLELFEERSY